jgi:hypothetical protein
MANNKDWQRRSDEWVKAMEESRRRKEARQKRENRDGATTLSCRRPRQYLLLAAVPSRRAPSSD